MRYVYVGLIGFLVGVVLLFALQNLGNVTIAFLTTNATLPLALLVFLVYVLGMVTGGAVLSALRESIRRAVKRPPGAEESSRDLR